MYLERYIFHPPFDVAWTPTQPECSVRVQLRGCQWRRPRHRGLIADLQRSVSKSSEEDRRGEEVKVAPTQVNGCKYHFHLSASIATQNAADCQLTDVAGSPSITGGPLPPLPSRISTHLRMETTELIWSR